MFSSLGTATSVPFSSSRTKIYFFNWICSLRAYTKSGPSSSLNLISKFSFWKRLMRSCKLILFLNRIVCLSFQSLEFTSSLRSCSSGSLYSISPFLFFFLMRWLSTRENFYSSSFALNCSSMKRFVLKTARTMLNNSSLGSCISPCTSLYF